MNEHHHLYQLLPEFSGTNLTIWTIAIEEIAFLETLSLYFTAELPTPDQEPHRTDQLKKRAKARMLLITSMSKEVIARLSPPILRFSPYTLYAYVKTLYSNDPMHSPSILRQRARNLQ